MKINVAYILTLLAEIAEEEASSDTETKATSEAKRKLVLDMLGSDVKLRSKRELIERFISDHMTELKSGSEEPGAFTDYWTEEFAKAAKAICEDEGIDLAALQKIIEAYHFTGKQPLGETIVNAMAEKPKILERQNIVERITEKLMMLIHIINDEMCDV